MKAKRLCSVILAIILVFALSACKANKDDIGTGSQIDNGDIIQYDITPTKPEAVASAAADHKPESGYDFQKSDEVIVPVEENVVAEGYTLTTKDEKTDETKSIASVYHEQGDINCLEIDIMTEGASNEDLEAAAKLVRELIESSFNNFPTEELDGQLPLSVIKIKELIVNNVQTGETVYGQDTAISISYEYYPEGGTLIYRIES